jgi:two-component system nitrogen regulation sensor histidine kinase NtrY
MFEPYFSTKRTGTGLGLAIVNSIIADHGGRVTAADNHPKGTIVVFELPLSERRIARVVINDEKEIPYDQRRENG